jgi:hypothetical protein
VFWPKWYRLQPVIPAPLAVILARLFSPAREESRIFIHPGRGTVRWFLDLRGRARPCTERCSGRVAQALGYDLDATPCDQLIALLFDDAYLESPDSDGVVCCRCWRL